MVNDAIAVILTALELEYQAVRERLEAPRLHRHSKGTPFETGTLPGTQSRIALGLVGTGNGAAGILTARAIDEFSPVAVVFCGVAGALRTDIRLGDLVVATNIAAYHSASSTDRGLLARPRVFPTDHAAEHVARRLARSRTWLEDQHAREQQPKVHFGTIAAGEVVQKSAISREARWLRQHYNDAIAIEMEAAGVAQAGHLNRAPVIVVRGISDHADRQKSADDATNSQPRAATRAAAFAVPLAGLLLEETHAERGNDMTDNTHPAHVNNYAGGTVGVQAGTISGSVHVSGLGQPATPHDITSLLTELRSQLMLAHSAGRLDADIYAAARQELDTATDAVRDPTLAGRSRAKLALRKLHGLVADVTDIAGRVAAVIAAIRGLS